MGRRTKIFYWLGILMMFGISFYKPMILLPLGKQTKGVIDSLQTNKITFVRRFSPSLKLKYPVIHYQLNNQKFEFNGGYDINDENYAYQEVKILYLNFSPTFAEVFTFNNLFGWRLIIFIIFIIPWFAFFSSFKNLFDLKKNLKPNNEGFGSH